MLSHGTTPLLVHAAKQIQTLELRGELWRKWNNQVPTDVRIHHEASRHHFSSQPRSHLKYSAFYSSALSLYSHCMRCFSAAPIPHNIIIQPQHLSSRQPLGCANFLAEPEFFTSFTSTERNCKKICKLRFSSSYQELLADILGQGQIQQHFLWWPHTAPLQRPGWLQQANADNELVAVQMITHGWTLNYSPCG